MRESRDTQRSSDQAGHKARGLTNGHHVAAGPNSRGKVNGLSPGRTNGYFTFGMTNGRTNGRVNGRTNGRTNGRGNGRVNGMTNGRTNGRVNGRTNGRTNGINYGRLAGFINGVSGQGRNGITNGFVNGAGAVNGFRVSYQERKLGVSKAPLRKKLLLVLPIVFIVVSLPYILVYTFPKETVEIDGYFMDWLKAEIYKDDPDSINPDTALSAYGTKFDGHASYFYLRTEGTILEGRELGADGFFIFVDTDANEATGYSVRGLGADAMVLVMGWNGTVMKAGTYLFNGTASSLDFGGFVEVSDPTVGHRDSEMELASSIYMNARSKVAICAMHTNITGDWSDANFRVGGPALEVMEVHHAPAVFVSTMDNGISTIHLTSKGATSYVTGLDLELLGSAVPISVQAFDQETLLGETSGDTLTFFEPLRVREGRTKSIDLVATLPPNSLGESFGIELNGSRPIIVDANTTWALESIQTGSKVSYIGFIPGQIAIDGAFADWDSRAPIRDLLWDAYSNKTKDSTTGDVDIDTVKLASTTDVASFYMSVNGTMLGGTSVPKAMVRFVSPGGPAPNVTGTPEPIYGSDFAFVFVDTDRNQSTGYEVGGSEAAIAVVGMDGQIIQSRLYRFASDSWTEVGVADAAIDSYQLEVSASYAVLGMVANQTYPVTFLTQDWSDRQDELTVALPARISAGVRAIGGILINEIYNNVPKAGAVDWIELYNTGTLPISLLGWEIYADGVLVYTFTVDVVLDPGELFVVTGLDLRKSTSFMVLDANDLIVDQVTTPTWLLKSYGRTGLPPYDKWAHMKPSPGVLNPGQVAIPEFGDLLLPITIIPIMLFAIRRSRKGKGCRASDSRHHPAPVRGEP